MPIVHVEMWPGRTHEQKAQLVKAITDDMVRILNCPPEAVTIVITDVAKENWAKGGVLASDQQQ